MMIRRPSVVVVGFFFSCISIKTTSLTLVALACRSRVVRLSGRLVIIINKKLGDENDHDEERANQPRDCNKVCCAQVKIANPSIIINIIIINVCCAQVKIIPDLLLLFITSGSTCIRVVFLSTIVLSYQHKKSGKII
jgi:hypothetical protein